MARRLSYSDFFDFNDDGVIRKVINDLNALKAAFNDFRKDVTGPYLGQYETQLQSLTNEIKRVADATNLLNITNTKAQQLIMEQYQTITKLTEQLNGLKSTIQGVKDTENLAADSIAGLTRKLNEQNEEWKRLSRTQDAARRVQLAGEIRQTTDQINAMNASLRNSTQAVNHAKGSYNALAAETRKLRQDMYAMADGLNFTGKNFDALKAKIRDNEARLASFDKSVSNNFRNINSAVGGGLKGIGGLAGKVVGVLGILAGIQSVGQLGSQIFEINKEMDALEFTLKTVSKTQNEFGRNQQFLARVANDYGVEIKGLTSEFSKFYAAATAANFNAQTTRTIFDQVSQVAGVLHLRQQDVNGVLNAFSQIASKGKVQAEELRGQIGERIPGAFAIAARAIGVSTVELNKMLKAGTVMSNEFLPKFAAELQKTFAGNAPKHIESLQASVNRLSNEFTELVRSEEVTDFFSRVVDLGTSVLSFFNDLSKSTNELVAEYQETKEQTEKVTQSLTVLMGTYDELHGRQRLSSNQQNILNNTIREVANIVPFAVTAWDKYGNAIDISKAKVIQFINAQNQLVAASRNAAKGQIDKELRQSLSRLDDINKDINRGKTKVSTSAGAGGAAAVDVNLIDPKTLKTTKEGQQLLNEKAAMIAKLQELDQRAADLNLQLPAKAQDFLRNLDSVEYDKTQVLRRLNSELDKYEKEVGRTQINLIKNGKDLSDNARRLQEQSLQTLINGRNSIRKQIANLQDPYAAQAAAAGAVVDDGADDKAAKKREAAANKAEQQLRKAIAAKQALLKAEADGEIAIEEARKISGEITEEQFRKNKLDIIKKYVDAAIKEEQRLGGNANQAKIEGYNNKYQEELNDFNKFLGEQYTARINNLKKQSEEALKVTQKDKEEQKKAAEEIEKKWVETQDRITKTRLDAIRKQYELDTALNGKSFARDRQYLDDTIAYKKRRSEDASKEEHERDIMDNERKKALNDGLNDLAWEAGKATIQIADEAFDAMYERRIAELEKQRDYELGLAGNNAAAKRAIEERFNKQVGEQRTKQAKADKIFGLFNVGINTAMGISKTIAQWGMPFAWPFIGMVAAQGLIQAALIAAKPIPKYSKGRGRGKDEFATINEQGFELIETDKKEYRIENHGKETTTFLHSKDVVHTHERSKVILKELVERHQTNRFIDSLLEGTNVVRNAESQRDDRLYGIMSRLVSPGDISDSFDRSVSRIPVNVTNISERGITQYTMRQGNRIRQMNSRNKFGGDG